MSARIPATKSIGRLAHCLLGVLFTVIVGNAAAQTVSQSPLTVGGNVPGNLLLVPSVEWPTLDSVANLGDYVQSRTYVGYFNSEKCYQYQYSATESDRHFYPVAAASSHNCSNAAARWSGNFLNWAATQTIDPFRKTLTGGYRVKDLSGETWLEKARHDGQGGTGIYPNRRIPASSNDGNMVKGATPFGKNWMRMRIQGLGNKMRFRLESDDVDSGVAPYDPATSVCESSGCEVSIRVKVCVSGMLEDNCKPYSGSAKPEGLIQKYSDRIRYSAFGYLNDSNMLRDGGALRARQKFVGANNIDAINGPSANPNKEWDTSTGVLIQNPDTADASATTSAVGQTIDNSGVINYINKFGQLTTQNHKSYDPVSELFYTALRYLKNQGNVPEYTNLSGSADEKRNLADYFPVITNWTDPMQYWCQNNAILGIGDVYTHRDKNLPGSSSSTDEPSKPSLVSGDSSVNVVTATQKVAQLEGISISTPYTGRENSAFIAGLAYEAHTKDLRTDLKGKQTVSTYWVDVRENQTLEPKARNQYWLAAKYGGFNVPDDFDPDTRTTALETSWWSSNDTLSTGDPRPKNFYVASEAESMVESLTRAFAEIAAQVQGSASSLASNSTRLETDTMTFQAQFFAGTWRGDLSAFSVDSKGVLSPSADWKDDKGPQTAGSLLDKVSWSDRKIYSYNPDSNKHDLFIWDKLSTSQKTALVSEDIVNYLRGDRAKEEAEKGGTLRTRTGILGDIVNSTPIYVGKPNTRLHAGADFTGASGYASFATGKAGRTPMIYVGSNDGMLHGFNANNGAELYAYVPNAVILNGLKQYSDPAYSHRYFVDGEIAVADVYDTDASPKGWKTVLVGTLGRGGPGIFALDVTDPTDVKFLWEKNGSDIPALGKNLGRPVIAQVADGDWRVIIGNGPESSSGSAQLIMIKIGDGAVTTVDTGVAGGNGLSAVLARDSTGSGFSDNIYAGDLLGNFWKFTGVPSSIATHNIFDAKDPSGNPQSITAAPLVGKDPATAQVWIFFGTGRYLNTADMSDKQIQTWYGLKDSDTNTTINGRSELVERKITDEGKVSESTVRVIEQGSLADIKTKNGWFLDLKSPVNGAEGERMVLPNRFQENTLIGTTRLPDATDACQPSGRGYIMALNPFTGGALDDDFFDVNRDGKIDESDRLKTGDQLKLVSGLSFDKGVNNPIFIDDYMIVNKDDGSTESIKVQAAGAGATRMNWREVH